MQRVKCIVKLRFPKGTIFSINILPFKIGLVRQLQVTGLEGIYFFQNSTGDNNAVLPIVHSCIVQSEFDDDTEDMLVETDYS